MAAPDPTRELDRDVALAAAAHQELLAALDLLVDAGAPPATELDVIPSAARDPAVAFPDRRRGFPARTDLPNHFMWNL
jgi:hypothetical protein